MNEQQIEQAANMLHDWNRAYCKTTGDPVNQPWNQAPEHQRQSAREAVTFVLHHSEVSLEAIHEEWGKARTTEGWVPGEVKNEDLKTHPNLVPYDQLPIVQRVKDTFAPTAVEFIKDLTHR